MDGYLVLAIAPSLALAVWVAQEIGTANQQRDRAEVAEEQRDRALRERNQSRRHLLDALKLANTAGEGYTDALLLANDTGRYWREQVQGRAVLPTINGPRDEHWVGMGDAPISDSVLGVFGERGVR